MSWSLVASTTAIGSSADSVTSSAIDTTGANLIVAASGSSGSPTFSDSENNTWTQVFVPSGNGGTALWYCENPTTSATHTFTESDANSLFGVLDVLAYSGAAASALDQSNSANGVFQPGSITPAQNGELIIAGWSLTAVAGSFSVDSGMSVFNFTDFSSGNNYGFGLATLVQSTAAAIDPTATLGAGTPVEAFIVSFKVGASGSVGTITGQATVDAEAGMIGSIAGAATVDAVAGFKGSVAGHATVAGAAGFIGKIAGVATVHGVSPSSAPQGVFARYTAAKGVGTLSAIPGEIPS